MLTIELEENLFLILESESKENNEILEKCLMILIKERKEMKFYEILAKVFPDFKSIQPTILKIMNVICRNDFKGKIDDNSDLLVKLKALSFLSYFGKEKLLDLFEDSILRKLLENALESTDQILGKIGCNLLQILAEQIESSDSCYSQCIKSFTNVFLTLDSFPSHLFKDVWNASNVGSILHSNVQITPKPFSSLFFLTSILRKAHRHRNVSINRYAIKFLLIENNLLVNQSEFLVTYLVEILNEGYFYHDVPLEKDSNFYKKIENCYFQLFDSFEFSDLFDSFLTNVYFGHSVIAFTHVFVKLSRHSQFKKFPFNHNRFAKLKLFIEKNFSPLPFQKKIYFGNFLIELFFKFSETEKLQYLLETIPDFLFNLPNKTFENSFKSSSFVSKISMHINANFHEDFEIIIGKDFRNFEAIDINSFSKNLKILSNDEFKKSDLIIKDLEEFGKNICDSINNFYKNPYMKIDRKIKIINLMIQLYKFTDLNFPLDASSIVLFYENELNEEICAESIDIIGEGFYCFYKMESNAKDKNQDGVFWKYLDKNCEILKDPTTETWKCEFGLSLILKMSNEIFEQRADKYFFEIESLLKLNSKTRNFKNLLLANYFKLASKITNISKENEIFEFALENIEAIDSSSLQILLQFISYFLYKFSPTEIQFQFLSSSLFSLLEKSFECSWDVCSLLFHPKFLQSEIYTKTFQNNIFQTMNYGKKMPFIQRYCVIQLFQNFWNNQKCLKLYVEQFLKILLLNETHAFQTTILEEIDQNFMINSKHFKKKLPTEAELYGHYPRFLFLYFINSLINESLSKINPSKQFPKEFEFQIEFLLTIAEKLLQKDCSPKLTVLSMPYSPVHRKKIRVWQALIVLRDILNYDLYLNLKQTNEALAEKIILVIKKYWKSLKINQISTIRNYLELAIVGIFKQFPDLIFSEIQKEFQEKEKNPQFEVSLMLLAGIFIQNSESEIQINEIFFKLIPYTTSNVAIIRAISQYFIFIFLNRIYQEKIEKFNEIKLNKICQDIFQFLSKSKEAQSMIKRFKIVLEKQEKFYHKFVFDDILDTKMDEYEEILHSAIIDDLKQNCLDVMTEVKLQETAPLKFEELWM